MIKEKKSSIRAKPIPEEKKELVRKLVEKIKNYRTVLIASTKNLPTSQLQKIKKSFRGKAEIVVAKKSIIKRAIGSIERGTIQNLKNEIVANTCLIFSDVDAFELAALLTENQSDTKAKAGDIPPEDINIEPGPTDLPPGPAISELGSVGLKVAVEGGKLVIKNSVTVAKKGEKIDEKVANVMSKLKITPIKVGFIPLAAYDSKDDMIHAEIKIDKKSAFNELRDAIRKAIGFAVNISFVTKETISYFIFKAAKEEKTLEKIMEEKK